MIKRFTIYRFVFTLRCCCFQQFCNVFRVSHRGRSEVLNIIDLTSNDYPLTSIFIVIFEVSFSYQSYVVVTSLLCTSKFLSEIVLFSHIKHNPMPNCSWDFVYWIFLHIFKKQILQSFILIYSEKTTKIWRNSHQLRDICGLLRIYEMLKTHQNTNHSRNFSKFKTVWPVWHQILVQMNDDKDIWSDIN